MGFEKLDKTWRCIIAVAIIGMILIPVDLAVSCLSDSGTIIKEDGELYMIRPGAGQAVRHFAMRAEVDDGAEVFGKKVDVSLSPYSEEETEEEEAVPQMTKKETAEYELRSVIGSFNEDLSLEKVKLPTELRSGAEVKWNRERPSHTIMIVMLTMAVMMAICRKKYSDERKAKRRREESVRKQLPEFVNRLVLLLQAGLVLNTAFEKSVEECIGSPDRGSDYFCKQMGEIYEASHKTNASMTTLFRSFAKESGMRELLRLSNIMEDNLHKGAALNAKLEAESENLWIERKKICEEKGRLTETTMLLPLFMFLIALIMITAAPAIIEL